MYDLTLKQYKNNLKFNILILVLYIGASVSKVRRTITERRAKDPEVVCLGPKRYTINVLNMRPKFFFAPGLQVPLGSLEQAPFKHIPYIGKFSR